MGKKYDIKNLRYDIPAGIIIALVSIPISMGYAEVAGIPAIKGLYASVLPIFIFGMISSSNRFVFGVDAAPAALMGGMLYSLSIESCSVKACEIVPVITVIVGCWLLIFAILDAGRVVRYISTPVMEGFITGISTEIIIMQIPKLFGGNPGTGELPELLKHTWGEIINNFNLISFVLGITTIIVILLSKKHFPEIPMAVIVMVAGVLLTSVFHIDKYGVILLPSVHNGVPEVIIPDFSVLEGLDIKQIIFSALTIALVIAAESLLATENYALKYDEKIVTRRELICYGLGNLASASCGCCPVNGSVSRTGIADQFGVKSQLMSIVAALTMLLILMFGTGFIGYLPVPVLTGIVISSLIGILEFSLAEKLRKVDRTEWFIFYAVFFAVLLLGTIYGVITGVILSFTTVIIRAAAPPVDMMGCIPGQEGFYSINRMRNAKPVKNTVIYQFKGSLFFANIGKLQEDLENAAMESGAKVVIVDARAVGSVDITAAERLMLMADKFQKQGKDFYITEHSGEVNDQLRAFGAGRLIEEGVTKRYIELALISSGIEKPYELAENTEAEYFEMSRKLFKRNDTYMSEEQTAEFEWAFGDEADEKMREAAEELACEIVKKQELTEEQLKDFEDRYLKLSRDTLEESSFIDLLEMQIQLQEDKEGLENQAIRDEIYGRLDEYRIKLAEEISEKSDREIERLTKRRLRNEKIFQSKHPEAYEHFKLEREKYLKKLEEEHPELSERFNEAKADIIKRKKKNRRFLKKR